MGNATSCCIKQKAEIVINKPKKRTMEEDSSYNDSVVIKSSARISEQADSVYSKEESSSKFSNTPEELKIDYEAEAKNYEERENYSMAILQYEKHFKTSRKSETLFKLSELNTKVRNFEKALEYAERLIDRSLKTKTEDLSSSKSSHGDTFINNSLEKIYQKAIHCLKVLAEESLDVAHIDKAIRYTKKVAGICKKANLSVASESFLSQSSSEIDKLEAMKVRIDRERRKADLKKLETEVNKIFEMKETECSMEEMEKNTRLWQIFKEKLDKKLLEIEAEERRVVSRKSANPPPWYECVISYELMKNPTTASDGYSYERKALDDLVHNYLGQSPLTRKSLDQDIMFPNKALLKAIEYYKGN